MFNANRPARSELPTTGKLLKSTGIAASVAGVILVTVVLPAEYGVDPTRVGSLLGLTDMGQIKRQLAEETEADAAADAAAAAPPVAVVPGAPATPVTGAAEATATPTPPDAAGARSDVTTIELAPNQGAELKMDMQEGDTVRFTWTSSGGRVNYDTHADRPGLRYHGYGKGSLQTQTGDLTAAFTGSHGWFWRNRTGETVTITVRTQGAYSGIKRVV